MKTWRIYYPDGTSEEVKGYGLRITEALLTIRTSYDSSYNRTSRSWPLVNVRSWEEI